MRIPSALLVPAADTTCVPSAPPQSTPVPASARTALRTSFLFISPSLTCESPVSLDRSLRRDSLAESGDGGGAFPCALLAQRAVVGGAANVTHEWDLGADEAESDVVPAATGTANRVRDRAEEEALTVDDQLAPRVRDEAGRRHDVAPAVARRGHPRPLRCRMVAAYHFELPGASVSPHRDDGDGYAVDAAVTRHGVGERLPGVVGCRTCVGAAGPQAEEAAQLIAHRFTGYRALISRGGCRGGGRAAALRPQKCLHRE